MMNTVLPPSLLTPARDLDWHGIPGKLDELQMGFAPSRPACPRVGRAALAALALIGAVSVGSLPAQGDTVRVTIDSVTVTGDMDPGTSATDLSDVYVEVTIIPQVGVARTLTTPCITDVALNTQLFEGYEFEPVVVEKGPVTVQWAVWDRDIMIGQAGNTGIGIAAAGAGTGIRLAQADHNRAVLTDQNANWMGGGTGLVPCDSQDHSFEYIAFLPGAASEITVRCTPRPTAAVADAGRAVLKNINARDWTLRLTDLWVGNENEDSDDEPYFAVIAFRSRFGVPGSTEVLWNGYLAEMEITDEENATWQPIPKKMGYARFHNVVPITSLARVASGLERPEVIGAVVLSMESDDTPFSTIADIINVAAGAIRGQIAGLVENGTSIPTQEQIGSAVDAVVGSMKASVMEDPVWFFLESWTDPDSVIGYHSFLFVSSLDPAIADSLPPASATSTVGVLEGFPQTTRILFDGTGIPESVLDLTGGGGTAYFVDVDLNSHEATQAPAPGSFWQGGGISQFFISEKAGIVEAVSQGVLAGAAPVGAAIQIVNPGVAVGVSPQPSPPSANVRRLGVRQLAR